MRGTNPYMAIANKTDFSMKIYQCGCQIAACSSTLCLVPFKPGFLLSSDVVLERYRHVEDKLLQYV